MDAKITKKRLNILLSYDWIKIILVAVAAIVVWSLIFTMTATRVTPAQNFTIFNYTGTSPGSGFNSYSERLKNVFSYDILEINATDATASEQYTETILQTRLSTNEGDALFAANVIPENESDQRKITLPDGTEKTLTYLEQFLYSYYRSAENFGEGGYLDEMAEYLNAYYNGDYKNGVLDADKVKEDFRARVKALKDKRFKTEAKLKAGEEAEIARIEGFRQNLIDFYSYLEKGYVSLQETVVYVTDLNGNVQEIKGFYSVNLCPDENTMKSLKDDVYYWTKDEDGASYPTAKDVNVVLLNIAGSKYEYSRWESLSFVNYLIKTHCSELN